MIGVIADDLSGAAEMGAIGFRHGLRAKIIIASKDGSIPLDDSEQRADLICIDTDTRSYSPIEAARRVRIAVRILTQRGAKWIYKKVDSVLRGQVTAEIEAMMHELQSPRVLLLPANPARGRVIRDGQYFVAGKLIHETEFARDPAHPRSSPWLRELMRTPKSFPLHICRSQDALPEEGMVIAEAATTDDLHAWATRMTSESFMAGAAEFFAALLVEKEKLLPSAKNIAQDIRKGGKELFVCGSTSEASRRFINTSQVSGTPVHSLPPELLRGAEFTSASIDQLARTVATAFAQHQRVILQIGLPLINIPMIGERLTEQLVILAASVLNLTNIECVYAEGGATAVALARQMNWNQLTVAGEIVPDVPTMSMEKNKPLVFTVKSGSYEWPPSIVHPI